MLPAWRDNTNALPVHLVKAEQVPSSLRSSATPSLDQVVVDDCDLLLGFDGDIRTLSPASIEFWEDACLEPFKAKADMSFVVIPPASTTKFEKSMLIEPFFESLSVMYEVMFRSTSSEAHRRRLTFVAADVYARSPYLH